MSQDERDRRMSIYDNVPTPTTIDKKIVNQIKKYNGEEEYTEKVDCFSFGMFVYELLTLQQPFTGYETVKELILGKLMLISKVCFKV